MRTTSRFIENRQNMRAKGTISHKIVVRTIMAV